MTTSADSATSPRGPETISQRFWTKYVVLRTTAREPQATAVSQSDDSVVPLSARALPDPSDARRNFNAISAEEGVALGDKAAAAEYAAFFLSVYVPEHHGWIPNEPIARLVAALNTKRAKLLDSPDYPEADTADKEAEWIAACDAFDQVLLPITIVVDQSENRFTAVAYRSDCYEIERYEVLVSAAGEILSVFVTGQVGAIGPPSNFRINPTVHHRFWPYHRPRHPEDRRCAPHLRLRPPS